jgi:hypothetical protein
VQSLGGRLVVAAWAAAVSDVGVSRRRRCRTEEVGTQASDGSSREEGDVYKSEKERV